MASTIERMVLLKPLIERAAAEGVEVLYHGMAGSILWGLGYTAGRVYVLEGEAAWSETRLRWAEHEMTAFPPSATRLAGHYAASAFGMIMEDPIYAMRDQMAGLTWNQMHAPKEKALAVRAFPELRKVPVHYGGMVETAGVGVLNCSKTPIVLIDQSDHPSRARTAGSM